MGNGANDLLLWLTGKMSDAPWITWMVGFCGGMFVGFMIWAEGMKKMKMVVRKALRRG